MTTAKDILIIEDNEILRDLVADWMLVAGYGVRVAADGDAGLAAVDDHPPDLVVTDIHMPVTALVGSSWSSGGLIPRSRSSRSPPISGAGMA
jgi:CheY-like chemotaxis protein